MFDIWAFLLDLVPVKVWHSFLVALVVLIVVAVLWDVYS